jgi:phosphotriesterase-related protein
MTVTGPVEPGELGFTLPHEHVLVDFGGADVAGPGRYDRGEVARTMRPYLEEVRQQGITGFVDCSPMYLARDVRILRTLAELTGLHIITNTGQYKEPFLPPRTFQITAEELAADWVSEWEYGIDGTDVRPGFIKTAVEPVPLAPTQVKVITAAALTSRATGLTIGTHTCAAVPALEILRILDRNDVDPRKWIFIHAQGEPDHELLRLVAREGCWMEIDAIGNGQDAEQLALVLKLLDWGCESQVLLSHDAGWYTVGEPGGGTPRPYTHLVKRFIPLMQRVGVDTAIIDRLTVQNPAAAFTVG